MCLLAFAWQVHPDYPLIFAGNRDEFHERPAAPAGWWQDAPDVIGGRDLSAGGSWLGLNRNGRFAVVTNQPRVPKPAEALSRGELVTAFLTGEDAPGTTMESIAARADRYAGFSLVAGTPDELHYLEHEAAPGHTRRLAMEPGCFGLSNTGLADHWPKVEFLERELEMLVHTERVHEQALFDLLSVTEPVEGGAPGTKSTPFVLGARYGTRASTVILVGTGGECRFVERRFDAAGLQTGETAESFELTRP